MPYSSNSDLPQEVRSVLPATAQSVWRNVFNAQVDRGLSEERAFQSAWGALKNQGWEKGDDGKWHKTQKIFLKAEIAKVDDDQRLVFGWASVIEENGNPVIDSQGDIIAESELEKAAYDFVLNARVAGEAHARKGVGQLVESIVFSKEKQETLGIDLKKIGWWLGFYITDDNVWKMVKSGEYPAFSIGGAARRGTG